MKSRPDVVGLARLNDISVNEKRAKTVLRMATARDNADILTQIRDIVKGQLVKLKADGAADTFTAAQAGILHRLAQTYAILDSHTEREHRKYDLSGESNEALALAEQQAHMLLAGSDE